MIWTGSITAYYEKLIDNLNQQPTHRKKTALRFILGLWAILFFCSHHAQVNAYETPLDTNNLTVNFQLSQEVKSALDNGISLTFDCKLQKRERWWLLSLTKEKKKYRFTLTHHALSNRYLVLYNERQTSKNFGSADEAVAFIIEQSVKFLQYYANNQDDTLMRLSLNKFKLLGPMRLNAFVANQWDIDTGWISWSPEI